VAGATGWRGALVPAALLAAVMGLLSGSGHLSLPPPGYQVAFPGGGLSSNALNSTKNVVALGDSVPAGTACNCVAFPARFAARLGSRIGSQVAVSNRGVPGLTSAGLASSLLDGQPTARDVSTADIVIITVGANDFDYADANPSCRGGEAACYASRLTELSGHLDSVLSSVAVLRHHAPTTVLVTGYWDIWQDGRVAAAAAADYVSTGKELTRQVNQQLQQASTRHGDTYVDLGPPFRGASGDDDDTGLLAEDGDHPNAAGHQIITDALLVAATGVPARELTLPAQRLR